jgi:hypothetical protein
MIVIKSVMTVMTFDFIEWTAWLDSGWTRSCARSRFSGIAALKVRIAGNDRRMYPATDYPIKHYIYDIRLDMAGRLDGWTGLPALCCSLRHVDWHFLGSLSTSN